MSRPPESVDAIQRADRALVALRALPDEPRRRRKLLDRIELFLWKFLHLRWYDAHRYFQSVEPIEVQALLQEGYGVGRVFEFFSLRQDEEEWQNTMVVGVALVFAAMKQAERRGFDPDTAGVFTLQRMLEQAVDEVDGLEALLAAGTPAP